MEKTKTKKALFMSVLSMVLCIAMLIGMTFAWFTDTASTGVNKIQAGNLQVGLMYKDADGKWQDAEGQKLEFVKAKDAENEDVFWEPGCRYQLPELRVVNNGNLALKYKILISGAEDATPDNDKNDLELLKVIDWTYKVDGNEYALGEEKHLAVGTADTNSYHTLTIEGKMQESAGNEYQGMMISGISITVYATQDTVESDSYGPDYDKNATYYPAIDVEGLKGVLANGGDVEFGQDIDLTGKGGSEQAVIKKDGSVDFKGNTLTGTLQTGDILEADPTADVTIKDTVGGNGYSIKATYRKESTGAMMQVAAIYVLKPTTTIESGKFTCNNAVIMNLIQGVHDKAGVVVNGGQFDATGEGVCLFNIIGKAVINGGVFTTEKEGAIIVADSGDSKQETVTTIDNGTFKGGYGFYFASTNGKVIVNGGNFTLDKLVGGASGTLVINGGIFNVDPSAYVGAGHSVTNNNDGTWTVN